jgi:hypothetical protein
MTGALHAAILRLEQSQLITSRRGEGHISRDQNPSERDHERGP